MAMANNIDTSLNSYRQINGTSDSSRTREDASGAAETRTEGSTTPRDTVEVTQSGRDMALLASAISNSSEVDQARVDAIRASVDDGSYTVDSTKVADRMFRMDQALPAT